MKKILAKFLICVIILSALLFSLVGCSDIITPRYFGINSEFSVTIAGVSGWDTLDFQISDSYWISVESLDESFVKCEDIQIEYNGENAVITSSYDSGKYAKFKLYFYELGSSDELKITYRGKTIKVKYNVVDYDFEAHGYENITSIDALDKYPEFKNSMLSIKYHEFEEHFFGIDQTWTMLTLNDKRYGKIRRYSLTGTYDENVHNCITTNYVPYLMDSIYYPSRFENHISSTIVYMNLPYDTPTNSGASKTRMMEFGLEYSFIPSYYTSDYPLRDMSFVAKPIEFMKTIETDLGESYPSPISILLERYPEKFFQYKLGDLTIYTLCERKGGASAYFFDETYFYSLGGYYN